MPEKYGEYSLIEKIKKMSMRNPEGVVVGIGDDCSVCDLNESEYELFTTDLLVENVHFLTKGISFLQIGYKSLAVNLSDIAAMGGIPEAVYLSIGVPKDLEKKELDDFLQGMEILLDRYDLNILGGDTTGSREDLVVNICLKGRVRKENLVLRSGAKAGDLLFVTGFLGDSKVGLEEILGNIKIDDLEQNKFFRDSHMMPVPEIEKGIFLGESKVNSLNDLSDGLATESNEISEASGKKLVLYQNAIPIRQEIIGLSQTQDFDPLNYALYGGEDYRLLGSVSSDMKDDLAEAYFNKFNEDLIFVGEVRQGSGVFLERENGELVKIEKKGYQHL